MIRRLIVMFVLALNIGGPALAQEMPDFYRATVPVRSQDLKERQYAAQKGLQEVLVRMSGTAEVLNNEEIQRVVGNAQRYIEQFQYQTETAPELVDRGYTETLSMVFSSVIVKRALRQANQPFWPENRPSVMVWIVEDNPDFGRQLLNSDVDHPLVKSVKEAANIKGLPLIFPLLDLEDQSNLSADQVWTLDEEQIKTASKRYGADVILVGKFTQTSRGEYWVTWQYTYRGSTRAYDNRADDINQLGLLGLAPLADELASRYAIVNSGQSSPELYLSLSGISGFGKYRQALDYLETMAMVSDVSLLTIERDTLLISLKSESDVKRFKSALQLDKKLVPEEQGITTNLAFGYSLQGSREQPLTYRWVAR